MFLSTCRCTHVDLQMHTCPLLCAQVICGVIFRRFFCFCNIDIAQTTYIFFFNWVRMEDHTLDKLHVKEYVIVILLVSRLPDHPSALVLHGHHRLVQFSSRGRAGE